jgi:hypothetical protein
MSLQQIFNTGTAQAQLGLLKPRLLNILSCVHRSLQRSVRLHRPCCVTMSVLGAAAT